MDGKLLEPGSFVDLKDGEEVDFGDGKRYIIRYAGAHVFLVCSYRCQPLHCMKEAAVSSIKPSSHEHSFVHADDDGKSAAGKRWLVER